MNVKRDEWDTRHTGCMVYMSVNFLTLLFIFVMNWIAYANQPWDSDLLKVRFEFCRLKIMAHVCIYKF